jgi:Pyrimidine dimer DNA glycosylase
LTLTSPGVNGARCRIDFDHAIWTLHPKYLDAKGLVALWREALPAQKVLRGQTRRQLLYEWRHLERKLKKRGPKRRLKTLAIKNSAPHPLFSIVPGNVRDWEKIVPAEK